jgi:predicted esterase
MRRVKGLGIALVAIVTTAGCSKDDEGGLGLDTEASPSSTGDEGSTMDEGSDDTGTSDVGGGSTPFADLCHAEPPSGAASPPPLPSYSGTCPELVAGRNQIESSDAEREFLLVIPEGLEPDEQVPVFFLWHWLGGSANAFIEQGDVQRAADVFRFVAVVPEAKGDVGFRWPFTENDAGERFEEELRFFDDMLACVAEQFAVNDSCISTMGVSAGGLWVSQLAQGRGEYLASFLALSGGTGDEVIRPWNGASRPMPAMVLWGGPDDNCFINFEATSHDLEEGLEADGHLILECVHNCAHSQPPFDLPMAMTDFEPLWLFALDHPYWLEAGGSPWLDGGGLPPEMPSWCSIGAGTAQIRDGECGPDQC